MDSKKLTQGLQQAFFSENHRLVFWYDPEQSFGDELANIDLPDVQVVDMDSSGLGRFGVGDQFPNGGGGHGGTAL